MPKAKAQSGPKVVWNGSARSFTWTQLVTHALTRLGGTASLTLLYSVIERHPRTRTRKHWKAKVRQVLEMSDAFVRVDRGVWSLSSKYKAKTLKKLNAVRRELYPKRAEG